MAVSKTRKGLGRGLSALIPDDDMEFLSSIAREDSGRHVQSGRRTSAPGKAPTARSASDDVVARDNARKNVDPSSNSLTSIAQLVDTGSIEANPFQPRRHFGVEEMQDLIASIREHGVLQPILVRPIKGSTDAVKFQLVAGERRWRAAQEAGLAQVPAVVREVEDQQALELAVIENVQRHDISPLEAALAYRRLANDFSLSQEDIARRVGKSRSAIANTLRLLDLPEEVQKALEDGTLSEGHGRAILLAAGDNSRRAVFRRIIRDKLSVRESEQIARATPEVEDEGSKSPAMRVSSNTPNTEAINRIQESLQKALGTRVKLQARAKGGRLQIEYYSNEDLSRIIELLLRAKA